ncbi:MAG: hypothetical protein Q9159_003311 [Coniocarpon cinnabarinum]
MSGRIVTQSLRSTAARVTPLPRIAFRGYATTTDTKPPVALFGIDGTYASALYTAAVKSSTLDSVASGLSALHNDFQRDTKLPQIIQAPSLSDSDKSTLVNELVRVAGVTGDGQKTFSNFLQTISDNNRMGVLPGVAEKFGQLMSAARGEVEMTVTSAAPLDAKVVRQLETAVSKSRFVGAGKKLKVVTKVQPDIRGGLVVEVGDRTIDLSVSARMVRMNKLLQDSL